jgi:hypothetical protein
MQHCYTVTKGTGISFMTDKVSFIRPFAGDANKLDRPINILNTTLDILILNFPFHLTLFFTYCFFRPFPNLSLFLPTRITYRDADVFVTIRFSIRISFLSRRVYKSRSKCGKQATLLFQCLLPLLFNSPTPYPILTFFVLKQMLRRG